MIRFAGLLLVGVVCASAVQAADGLVTRESRYSAEETLDRLEAALKKKGITIFARVSHTAGANSVGIELRPTELLIFGNPKLGSQFFTSKQTAGIDLPMKALAWQDAGGQVWLSYNDPQYIADRHCIADRAEIIARMSAALARMSAMAAGAAVD